MAVSLTRAAGFHAWHGAWRPDWTPTEYHAAFGALADPSGVTHTRVRVAADDTLHADCTRLD